MNRGRRLWASLLGSPDNASAYVGRQCDVAALSETEGEWYAECVLPERSGRYVGSISQHGDEPWIIDHGTKVKPEVLRWEAGEWTPVRFADGYESTGVHSVLEVGTEMWVLGHGVTFRWSEADEALVKVSDEFGLPSDRWVNGLWRFPGRADTWAISGATLSLGSEILHSEDGRTWTKVYSAK
jgi:hypothetical protein